MANNPKLHVIWGAGRLGMAVMRALTAKGETVRMVNRSGKANVLANVSVVAADAYNLDSAREACQGATVVYLCAKPPNHEWPQKFPPLQANILESAASAGAKLIIGENLYMYGEVPNRPLTEDLPIAATTRKGRTRAQMAEAALAAHRNGKVQVAKGLYVSAAIKGEGDAVVATQDIRRQFEIFTLIRHPETRHEGG